VSELKIGSGSGIHFRVRVVRIVSEIRVRTFGHSDNVRTRIVWLQIFGPWIVWAVNYFGPCGTRWAIRWPGLFHLFHKLISLGYSLIPFAAHLFHSFAPCLLPPRFWNSQTLIFSQQQCAHDRRFKSWLSPPCSDFLNLTSETGNPPTPSHS